MSITQKIELINKKKFVKATLNKNIEVFVVYVSSSSLGSKMTIQPAWKAQIVLLLAKKIIIPAKYANFSDVFLKKSAKVLQEHIGINKNAVELEDGKQPPYRLIYSLGLIKLETLKTYIQINLANNFIQPSKFLAGVPILFVHKPNGSLRFCINYQGLNNLTIKNRYLFPLIGESLNRLWQAIHFT